MGKCVLVTGGTGKTGSVVSARLMDAGIVPRIATRTPSSPNHIPFDWANEHTYDAALDGVAAVYLVAPTDRTDQLGIMKPFLELAAARDPMRLVLLSASSLEEGGPMMGEVHAWLRSHARHWTALRPSWFMQNFVTQHLQSIRAEGRVYSATQDGRVPFIDVDDIAAVAVRALTDHHFPSGEQILTGPRAITYDEVAALISASAGFPVQHVRLTADELALRYAGLGLPVDYAQLLARMDEAIANGAGGGVTSRVEDVTGRPPQSLETFLARSRYLLLEKR